MATWLALRLLRDFLQFRMLWRHKSIDMGLAVHTVGVLKFVHASFKARRQ